MRIVKIELAATIESIDPDISLASDSLREQLGQELDALTYELGESVRRRAIAYFPSDYTVFVRFYFRAEESRAKIVLWIDDPTVGWPSGLFTRRAWGLLVPIVIHVVQEAFETRVKSVRIDIDEKKARVASLAPARVWNDPVILTVALLLIGAGYWLIVHPWMWAWINRIG